MLIVLSCMCRKDSDYGYHGWLFETETCGVDPSEDGDAGIVPSMTAEMMQQYFSVCWMLTLGLTVDGYAVVRQWRDMLWLFTVATATMTVATTTKSTSFSRIPSHELVDGSGHHFSGHLSHTNGCICVCWFTVPCIVWKRIDMGQQIISNKWNRAYAICDAPKLK